MQLIEFDTPQETFDFVVGQMIKQGRRSTAYGRENLQGGRFRSEDGSGAKCSVGHLIRDEDVASLGRGGIENLYVECGLDVKFYKLVQALQDAHDNAFSFEEVLLNYIQVAVRFELDAGILGNRNHE